jgi:PAS domain S-box-containing protein
MRNLVPSALLFVVLAAMWTYVSLADRNARIAANAQEFADMSDAVSDTIARRVANRLRGLAYIQQLAREGALDDPRRFDIAAATTHEIAREFLAINLLDAERRIVRTWPQAENSDLIGRIVGQSPSIVELLDAARDTDTARSSGIVDLFQGGKGIASYFPIWRDGRFVGYVNGVFRIEALEQLLGTPRAMRYAWRIDTDEQAAASLEAGVRRLRIPLLDRTLTVEFAEAAHAESDDFLFPGLAVGIFLSLVCAVLTFVGLNARYTAARDEAMLSSILTAAPDAIISLDENRRIRVFTPAAEKMFQRSAESMIGEPLDALLPDAARPVHHAHVEQFAASPSRERRMGDWRLIRGLRADGQTFPVMVQLAKSQFEGERLMTAVLRDMTDMERMNGELVSLADERARQAERAEAANHAKTMFLATMSHELRTPLNAIIGFSDIAVREMFGPIGNARYKEYLANIKSSGEDLLTIINDVLDLSKAEVGAYRFEPEDVDVCDLLSSTARQLMPLFDSKGLKFRSALPGQLMARADPRAIRQIVVNLLSNSIKFTSPGGIVTLGAAPAPDAGFVEFSVQDTGRGIAPDDLDRVGRPFVQVGDAYRSEVKGTGLGLAISRTFSAGMGGNLRIESELGHGTTVTVSLPAAPAKSNG